MQERGAWRYTAIRVSARGAAVILLVVAALWTAVAEGQARVGQKAGRATVGTPALSTEWFYYTGGEQTYTVPAGVTRLHVRAVGGTGATGAGSTNAGGVGGLAIGDLPVAPGSEIAPGDKLYVEVGGSPSALNFGAFNGGGVAPATEDITGGSGGGATDLRVCSRSATSCPYGGSSAASRLIVAGGGGGTGSPGADGGAGGQPGRPLAALPNIGGSGGTPTAPGAAGLGSIGRGKATPGSVDGTGGTGGTSPVTGGGGGGGGYTGGGGGAVVIDRASNHLVSGGGGGGASFASPMVTGVSFSSYASHGQPIMVITPVSASGIGLTRPVVPKLQIAIRGPRGVRPGHAAAYRITLGRTQPDHGRGYAVRNVHVVSAHAGRRVGQWLIRTLPPRRSRILRLKLNVPSTAHGSFCITTRAAARHTRNAAVRHCTVVETAPPRGLG